MAVKSNRYLLSSLFLSFLALVLKTATAGPQPGDLFDYDKYVFPPWWFTLRDQYGFKEVRKCPFLHVIPDTLDYCPPVAKQTDHYYCIFGTDEEPTWFCTCVENVEGKGPDYHFHCSGTEILTVENLEHQPTESVDVIEHNTTAIPEADDALEQPLSDAALETSGTVVVGGGGDDNGHPISTSEKSEQIENEVGSLTQEQQQQQPSGVGNGGRFASGFASGFAAGVGIMLFFPTVVFFIISRSKRIAEKTEIDYSTQATVGKLDDSWISTDEIDCSLY